MVTPGSPPSIAALGGSSSAAEHGFALSIEDGMLALTAPADVEAHVTVLGTDLGT
jgi:hypothetical protein